MPDQNANQKTFCVMDVNNSHEVKYPDLLTIQIQSTNVFDVILNCFVNVLCENNRKKRKPQDFTIHLSNT